MLTMLMALTANSYAAPDFPVEVFEPVCEFECNMDGWRLEISESTTDDKWILSLIPQDIVWQFGSDLYQAGDTLIATGVNASDGYCVAYPTQAAFSIIGNVYQRYHASPLLTYGTMATTPPLTHFTSMGDPCGMDLNYLLDVVDMFKEQDSFVTPTSCSDLSCLIGSGGGVDPEPPDDGFWTYTDASGEVVSFDDFWTPGSGGGPVDVEEHLEDKKPEVEQAGNNGNSNGGNPNDEVKEEIR